MKILLLVLTFNEPGVHYWNGPKTATVIVSSPVKAALHLAEENNDGDNETATGKLYEVDLSTLTVTYKYIPKVVIDGKDQ